MARSLRIFLGAVLLLLTGTAFAGKQKSVPDGGLDDYLRSARQSASSEVPPPGSLWQSGGRFTEIAGDYKAHAKDDTIVIRVVEDTSAVESGTVKTDRKFSASSGINGIAGQNFSELSDLFSPQSQRTLNGSGATSSTSTIRSNLAGRVVEVLPNGSLVVEAVRDLIVSNQHQTLIVRGIVRPGDVAADNSVLSSSVANLQLELKGKGVISDATERPNVVIRVLLKILNF
jgi:flagellar L-ring protein FlgH